MSRGRGWTTYKEFMASKCVLVLRMSGNAISLPKDSSGEHYIPTDMMLRLMIRDQEERFITLIIGVRCSLVSSFLSFSYSVCWPPPPSHLFEVINIQMRLTNVSLSTYTRKTFITISCHDLISLFYSSPALHKHPGACAW